MNSPTFEYNNLPTPIEYKGCFYHSLLEFRYVLMIEDTHAYLREGIEIYYDDSIMQSTLYIREGTKKYVPDFLIRNRETKKAFLTEIKPDGFDHYEYLSKRKKVSEHFIQTYQYDWEYKVIYSSDIILSEAQYKKYKSLLSYHKERCQQILKRQNCDRKVQEDPTLKYFNVVPFLDEEETLTPQQYRLFVRKGVLPAMVP